MLVCVAGLIGISVAIGGSIAFVGLIVPHMMRMMTGPNHKKLLEFSAFGGAAATMLVPAFMCFGDGENFLQGYNGAYTVILDSDR